MARKQMSVQLSDDLLERLDRYRALRGRSRSEIVGQAIEDYIAADREAEIDRLIIEAYLRHPTAEVWGQHAAKDLIEEEPW
jgi:metal-responsive CopG/Arc/MetJ family transcriptional regulator